MLILNNTFHMLSFGFVNNFQTIWTGLKSIENMLIKKKHLDTPFLAEWLKFRIHNKEFARSGLRGGFRLVRGVVVVVFPFKKSRMSIQLQVGS